MRFRVIEIIYNDLVSDKAKIRIAIDGNINKRLVKSKHFNYQIDGHYLGDIKEINQDFILSNVSKISILPNKLLQDISIYNYDKRELIIEMIEKGEFDNAIEVIEAEYIEGKYNNIIRSSLLNYVINEKLKNIGVNQEIIDDIEKTYHIELNEIFYEKPYIFAHYNLPMSKIIAISSNNKIICKAKLIQILENSANEQGHTFLYKEELADKVCSSLSEIDDILYDLSNENELIIERDLLGNECIYLNKYWKEEDELAKDICEISNKNGIDSLTKNVVDEYFLKNTFNKEQEKAVINEFGNQISVISGEAGTGKTTTIKAIVECTKKINPKSEIELLAFTGKAVEKLRQEVGMEAKTIHTFIQTLTKRNSEKIDMIVVDEASMVSLSLFYKLIHSIIENKKIRIILVGDANQLHAIGAGKVFQELMKTSIPITNLTEVKRQSEGNIIIDNSRKVLRSIEINKLSNGIKMKRGEFEFYEVNEFNIKNMVLKEIKQLLDNGVSIEDIQVISPIKSGKSGVDELNKSIAQTFNYVVGREFTKFGVLDKVMQMENNYQNNIFNGQVGQVIKVSRIQNDIEVHVLFDKNHIIIYKNKEIKQLDLAFSTTIHKMQGSDCKVIILVMSEEHVKFLDRNLIYVALTRAKERCIIIGNKNVFNDSILKKVPERNSNLAERINNIEKCNHGIAI